MKAQSETDEKKRTALYRDVQLRLRDTGGLLLWGHPDWMNAVSARLHGVEPAPPNTLDWARFDTVWLA